MKRIYDEKIYKCESCIVIAEKDKYLKTFCKRVNTGTCQAVLKDDKIKVIFPKNNN